MSSLRNNYFTVYNIILHILESTHQFHTVLFLQSWLLAWRSGVSKAGLES